MDMELQVVIDGIPHDLSGIKYMAIDTEKEEDLTIESNEEGVGQRMISLTIVKPKK